MLTDLLSKGDDVLKMVSNSNLSEKVKDAYSMAFKDKVKRMGF